MDAVYHLAAYQDYLPDFSTYFHVNAVSTALLYELIVEHRLPVRKVVVASSQAVLGRGALSLRPSRHVPARHSRRSTDAPRRVGALLPVVRHGHATAADARGPHEPPESVRAVEGQRGEDRHPPRPPVRHPVRGAPLLHRAGAQAVVLQRVFGGHAGSSHFDLYFRKAPTIYEDGQQIRDFVNIGDVVRANLLVLQEPAADYRVFNVGGGRPYTVREFFDILCREVEASVEPIIEGDYRYGDTRHIISDISQLIELGWTPSVPIEESIRQYWRYLNEQSNVEDILQFAERRMKDLQVVRRRA